MASTPADIEFEGAIFPITIDENFIVKGEEDDVFPPVMRPYPTPIQDHVDTMDGGSQTFQPSFGDGHCDFADRWVFEMTFESINGPMKLLMERIRTSGIIHTLTIWKPCMARYTSDGAQPTFYLPHRRSNAAHVLAGKVFRGFVLDTAFFPVKASVDGAPLVVDYADGPVLAAPAAGHLAVARLADATGHVQLKPSAALVRGSVLEVIFVPLFQVTMTECSIEYPAVGIERHTYKFMER